MATRQETRGFDDYLECALWCSTYGEDDENHMDDGEHDMCPRCEKLLRAEFDTLLDGDEKARDAYCDNPKAYGHDLWLTRNWHGAGFWDGDWPDPVGEYMTKVSQDMGECSLYVGDDGFIHFHGSAE